MRVCYWVWFSEHIRHKLWEPSECSKSCTSRRLAAINFSPNRSPHFWRVPSSSGLRIVSPPNNFGKIFFSIEKLLFYCCLTAPGRFEVGTGTPLFPVTPEQVYRRMCFEALDFIVSSIEERFDQPSFKAYSNMESLLIGVLSSQDARRILTNGLRKLC